ncbi:MAG: non-homologous end-joining DNA ligase [Acidimicrobiia bacterium]|nr:non-homologous end-joining DNA ligase [Acidimicrobiia bacterium]
MASSSTPVSVDNRILSLSNLDKILYPEAGFTKGEVIHYYSEVASAALPHLSGRCITLRRWPDGVNQPSFFEKRCPSHRPEWVPVSIGPGNESEGRTRTTDSSPIAYCRIEERAALVWTANLAALELHAPMARATSLDTPTAVVFDLDPGSPATIVECAQRALDLRELLQLLGMKAFAKTSGSKGMQVYVPLNTPTSHEQCADFALGMGQILMQRSPSAVTVTMAKSQRTGKVFVDWSQNARHKTTIAPYSLRAKGQPTVSAPVTWDEVATCADGDHLSFTAPEVLERVARLGDLFAPVQSLQQELPVGSNR